MRNLQFALDTSFFTVFVAFLAGAFFLYLERDRVPEQYKLAVRVSCVYLTIAAINYFYMKDYYEAGNTWFPTSFRYVDWILTTPLMLLKFPLILGLGPRGRKFMIRLVVLDFVMIATGFLGEVSASPGMHYGMFLAGCVAWFAIMFMLITALTDLPDRINTATRKTVRVMTGFLILGWAIYPAGYMIPLLGTPFEVRELLYNVGDLVNKLGLTLTIYVGAKQTMLEREFEAEEEEEEEYQEQPEDDYLGERPLLEEELFPSMS
ncbi:MAG: bacteriorhodopsin [Myxococcota bacterium]